MIKSREQKRTSRHARIRAKVKGTPERPRLAVYKSNQYITLQLINDETSHTMVSVTSQTIKTGTPMEKAKKVGAQMAELAKKAGIDKVVFDRGGYIYTGKIKIVADAAREAGLEF